MISLEELIKLGTVCDKCKYKGECDIFNECRLAKDIPREKEEAERQEV